MTIAHRVRNGREGLGWSLEDLARQASVSKSYLWQLESGRSANPSMDVLIRIAEALDTTIAALLGTEGVRAADDGELEGELDSSLAAFLSERRRSGHAVPQEDIRVLQSIQRRGEHPSSSDDWELLLKVIRKLSAPKT